MRDLFLATESLKPSKDFLRCLLLSGVPVFRPARPSFLDVSLAGQIADTAAEAVFAAAMMRCHHRRARGAQAHA
jgi:hypothetical protein